MSSIKTYLRKIKYNFTYLFKSKLELPSDFRLFNRRDTNYQQFIYKHCRPDKNTNLDLGRGLKIFGKISDEYVINSDIFSNFNFSNKKFYEEKLEELKYGLIVNTSLAEVIMVPLPKLLSP